MFWEVFLGIILAVVVIAFWREILQAVLFIVGIVACLLLVGFLMTLSAATVIGIVVAGGIVMLILWLASRDEQDLLRWFKKKWT